MKRKSYRITKAGSLNNLNLVEEEISRPADNEVRIAVKAIGLNFADVFTIMGLYKPHQRKISFLDSNSAASWSTQGRMSRM